MGRNVWTYLAVTRWIERLAPCFHDKGVIDGDHVDVAGSFGFGAVYVPGNMRFRTTGA